MFRVEVVFRVGVVLRVGVTVVLRVRVGVVLRVMAVLSYLFQIMVSSGLRPRVSTVRVRVSAIVESPAQQL